MLNIDNDIMKTVLQGTNISRPTINYTQEFATVLHLLPGMHYFL